MGLDRQGGWEVTVTFGNQKLTAKFEEIHMARRGHRWVQRKFGNVNKRP